MLKKTFLSMTSVLLAFSAMGQADGVGNPPMGAAADDPMTYLSRTWFHKGDNLNLLTTPGGRRLAVDDAGLFIADESLAPETRNIRFQFDTIHEQDGAYYIARDLGNHGYDYIPIGKRGQFPTAEGIMEQELWRQPLFRTTGHHFDADPGRGNPALAIFPDDEMFVVCGQSQWDSRTVQIGFMNQDGKTPGFDIKNDLPIHTGAGSSVRAEDLPDRVFVDQAGGGFWYLGSGEADDGGRQLMLAFAKAGKKTDGSPTVTLSKPNPVGAFDQDKFEAGTVVGDKLFLLLARKHAKFGGVDPERRLLRVDRETGEVKETKVTFDVYLDDVKLTALGGDVVVYGPDKLYQINGETMESDWGRTLPPGADEVSYSIYRAVGSKAGDKLAIGMASAYRKPGEKTRVLIVDAQGRMLSQYELKPGSIDELVFTDDGGLLVFSAQYTAKIGGGVDVKANEAAAIAKTRNRFPATPPADQPVKPFAYLETPRDVRFKVWFDKPAGGFGRASLPIGNGHMGVMLDGGTDNAGIVFNVDSHWTGDSRSQGAYQGFGRISVMLGHDPKQVTGYRRELDLRTGIHTLTYRYEGVRYKREAFASYPAGLFAIRFSADKPGALSGHVELMSNHPAEFIKGADGMRFAGALGDNGRTFEAVLGIDTEGGRVVADIGKDGIREVTHRRNKARMPYNTVRVEGADRMTLYLAADTDYSSDAGQDFRGEAPSKKLAPRLARIGRQTFDEMRQAAAADVAALFDRCTLDLATDNPDAEDLPIDQRKAAYGRGASDPGFEALVFAAQRHMMIACSRPGSLAANLQGIWNDSNWPAWTSDYHADINIQMAYWFTEPANLAECAEPMLDYIESQIPVRRRHSKERYGENVRGWNVHYMNNIFGGFSYKDYPGGSAWYAQHFAEHFKFNQDRAYLENRAYPLVNELSQHWQDLLIERPDGQLVTPRTMSPEHKPPQYGISQDLQLVYNLFSDFVSASKRLGRDDDFREMVADMRSRLLPIQIGRWGQIQEWERDRDSRFSTHRHPHQMIAAFPGSQITTDTPELAEAVVTGLEARGRGGNVGWSQVWRINIFARLGRPDLAYRQVRIALPGFHDHLIWQSKNQIDAPSGYAAGVCEMLLQSHRPLAADDSRFLIELLPALPGAWPSGRIQGLRARGGFEVDIEWADGKLTAATIRNINSPTDRATVRYGDQTSTLTVPRGGQTAYHGPVE